MLDLGARSVRPGAVVPAGQVPAGQVPAGQVRALARHIVSEPQFRQPGRSWLDVAADWVVRVLARPLAALVSGGRATVVGWVVIVAAVVIAVVLVGRFSRRVRCDPGLVVAGPPAPARRAADWAAAAAGHAAAGEWRQAQRCRYRALVAGLAENGVLDEIPGRTTGEYLRVVTRNLPAAATEFAGASELFEASWYGGRRVGQAEDEQLEALRRQVLDRTGAR